MCLYLRRVYLVSNLLDIPWLEGEGFWVYLDFLCLLNVFIANDRLDLVIRVVNDELLNGLVWHLGLLLPSYSHTLLLSLVLSIGMAWLLTVVIVV